MNKPIEPKPTQYGNVLFRSRLEARWAVLFDFTKNILNWEYEPRSFDLPNGWSYTPDFLIKLYLPNHGEVGVYVEIKPDLISANYSAVLGKFCKHHKISLMCFQGSIWPGQEITSRIYIAATESQHLNPQAWFADFNFAYNAAVNYRFDLKDG